MSRILVAVCAGTLETVPRWRWLLIAVGCAAIGGVVAVAGAGAQLSSQLSWSKAVRIDRTVSLNSVACTSPGQCTAIDAGGHAVTFDPATLHASAPRKLRIGATFAGESSFACSPAHQCALVNTNGYEATFLAPSGRIIASARVAEPHQCGVPTCGTTLVYPSVTAIACPGPHLCVTTTTWGSSVSFDPAHPHHTTLWWTSAIPNAYSTDLLALGCPAAHQCTALDNADDAVTFDPTKPTDSTPIALRRGNDLDTLACSKGQCTALDSKTGVTVTFDPHSQTPLATTTITSTSALTQVECPSADLCVALDERGRGLAADPRTDTAWKPTPIAGMSTINDITCPSATRCIAVGQRGHAAIATLSTP